jgi:hypothetical protein
VLDGALHLAALAGRVAVLSAGRYD